MNEVLCRLMSYWFWAVIMQPFFCVNAQAVLVSDELIPTLRKPGLVFLHLLLPLLILIGLAWSIPVHAEEVRVAALSSTAAHHGEDSIEAMPVEFMNRHIFTIRSGYMGYSQEERAMAIRHRIEAAMAKGGNDYISFRPAPEGGRFIELNGLAVFQIRPGDLDPLTGESLDEVANNAAQNLKIAVREAREQSNTDVMLKGIGFVALASVFFSWPAGSSIGWECG